MIDKSSAGTVSADIRFILRSLIPFAVRRRVKRFLRNIRTFPATLASWKMYRAAPRLFLPPSVPVPEKLSFRDFRAISTGTWYHDFELLGMKTTRLHPNQRSKQELLFPLIDAAIEIGSRNRQAPSGLELFCADGYYGAYALRNGAGSIFGIDRDIDAIDKARATAHVLGLGGRATFACRDVFRIKDSYDFCICAGGLYHLERPDELLLLLRRKIRSALVIQTMYSMSESSVSYFESPAPGWSWGCRFSYARLLGMVEDCGFRIVSAARNELEGNERPEDRGSAYLLCVPR